MRYELPSIPDLAEPINSNCVGWLLDDMREAIERHNSTCKYPVRIIETAPPRRPPRRERPTAPQNEKQFPEVHYGGWRVLHCQQVGEKTELIVAREQILSNEAPAPK